MSDEKINDGIRNQIQRIISRHSTSVFFGSVKALWP